MDFKRCVFDLVLLSVVITALMPFIGLPVKPIYYAASIFIVLNTLVKTMHFQCKALASTNVLKVRIRDEKWKPHNKPNTNTFSLGHKI